MKKQLRVSLLILLPVFFSIAVSAQKKESVPAATLKGHKDDVVTVAFSPNGKYIVSGSWDKSIKVYTNDSTYSLVYDLAAHGSGVTSLFFSRDSRFLYSGSKDFTAKQWDLTTGTGLRVFGGHTSSVNTVIVDGKGRFVFTGSSDGTIKVWDLEKDGANIKTITVGKPVYSLAISADGGKIFCGTDEKTITVYSPMGAIVQTLTGHTDAINSLIVMPNTKQLLSGSSDKTAILWDIRMGTQLKTFTGHTAKINAVASSPDSKYIITGSNDGTAMVWDVDSVKAVITFEGYGFIVRSVSLNSDNTLAASAAMLKNSDDYGARVWRTGIVKPVKPVLDKSGKPKPIPGDSLSGNRQGRPPLPNPGRPVKNPNQRDSTLTLPNVPAPDSTKVEQKRVPR